MAEFIDKLLMPIVTGTIFGFVINWFLEWIRAKRRRNKILAALLTYLFSLPRFNTYNQMATNPTDPPKHLVPMLYPITPFEVAVFSDEGVSVSEETLQATTDYLIKAGELNALIQALQESHFVSIQDETVGSISLTRQFLYDQARDNVPKIVEKLRLQIEREQNWLVRLRRYIQDRKNKSVSKTK